MPERRDRRDPGRWPGARAGGAHIRIPRANRPGRESGQNGRCRPGGAPGRSGWNRREEAGDSKGAHGAILAAGSLPAKGFFAGSVGAEVGRMASRTAAPATWPGRRAGGRRVETSFDPVAAGPDDGGMRILGGWLLLLTLAGTPLWGQPPPGLTPYRAAPPAGDWEPAPGPWKTVERALVVIGAGATWQVVISEREIGSISGERTPVRLVFPRIDRVPHSGQGHDGRRDPPSDRQSRTRSPFRRTPRSRMPYRRGWARTTWDGGRTLAGFRSSMRQAGSTWTATVSPRSPYDTSAAARRPRAAASCSSS